MTRLLVWCELVCRQCSHSTSGSWSGGQIPKRRMVLEARQRGWLTQGSEIFCGNHCLSEFKKEVASAENVEQNSEHGQG